MRVREKIRCGVRKIFGGSNRGKVLAGVNVKP